MKGEELQKFLDDVLAVLVLYRRDLAAAETFSSLSRALDKSGSSLELLVYDNSPAPMVSAGGRYPGWRIHHIHDPENPGVSRAYNEGFRLAERLGKKWLLLLDQDTVFPDDALSVYCQGIAKHRDMALFAPVLMASGRICSPCRYLFRTGFHPGSAAPGVHPFPGRAVLNSGMLVAVDAFARCGGFDERIGLDFADFAFNNRLRRFYDKFCVLPMECSHGFSGAEDAGIDAVLQRFRLYCEGGRRSIDGVFAAICLTLVVLVRCLRLTFRFRSLRFPVGYLRHFVGGTRNEERGARSEERG